MPGFQEAGPSMYALNVRGSNKTNVALSPMVEVGGRFTVDGDLTLRPFVAIGVDALPNNTRSVDASFVSASPADGTFRTFVDSPSLLGSFDLGVQLYRAGGFEVRADYNVKVG